MILRRYMTQQVASTTALVLGFLVVMMLGGRLIRYFGIAAEGNLEIHLLFAIIGYNLPYFLELILPLAFFIALMLVFGRLYVDQEMAVINASGLSRGKLARLITPLILVLFASEAALSVVGKPWGVRSSEVVWQQQALTGAFDLIRPKEFISSGKYHLYVGSLSDDKKQLQDVILIESEPRAKGAAVDNTAVDNTAVDISNSIDPKTAQSLDIPMPAAVMSANISTDTLTLAKRAEQVETHHSGVTQLDLFQGRRYEVAAGRLKYNQVGFDRYRITLTEPSKKVLTEDNVETQAIGPLWRAATGGRQVNGNGKRAAQAELGYRFALPWLMIIAPMLAVPLAQVRPRQGRWLRLFPAILLFVSCALGIISLKNAVSQGSVSVWAYAWLVLGFMALALYLNWGSRVQHRLRFRKPEGTPSRHLDHQETKSPRGPSL